MSARSPGAMTREELIAFVTSTFPEAGDAPHWVDGAGEGWLEMTLPFDRAHLRPGGTLSGPALMTLADTASYFLVLTTVGPAALAVTSSLHIDFLRKPRPDGVRARAELLRRGRRLIVARVTMSQAGDPRPVAHASVTYALPDPG